MSPDYQLWHGDCLQEMDRIESGSVDMILADLPYQTTENVWDTIVPLESLWKQYKRVIKKQGAIILTAVSPFNYQLYSSNPTWFKYEWIWNKCNISNPLMGWQQPLRQHEFVMVFYKSAIYNPQMVKGRMREKNGPRSGRDSSHGGRVNILSNLSNINDDYYPKSIIEFSNAAQNGKIHPTQKPVALLRYLIRTYSNPGDLILDNCAGSGSTLEAAMRENRRSIGIELYPLPDKPIGDDNPDYFGIASKRLANVARELRGEWKPLRDNGGSFEGLPLLESIQC